MPELYYVCEQCGHTVSSPHWPDSCEGCGARWDALTSFRTLGEAEDRSAETIGQGELEDPAAA